MMSAGQPLTGRRAQAARNDTLILNSARTVFMADPGAPVTAVARQAGVGISALYARYPSKDDLLRKVCVDGLRRFIAETEAALDDDRDHWSVLTRYMRRVVDADTSSVTRALAGQFPPTPEVSVLSDRADQLLGRLYDKIRGVLRPGASVHDLSVIFDLVAAVKVAGPERTSQLRQRYLALIMDGLRAADGQPLPGPPC